MKWIKDLIKPQSRLWEEFYRNRWQHDRIVRSTHGVNCTGSCSWNVYVKDGIITWEMQATDYPLLRPDLPPYEPRGCARGISASWYVYSPLRVKYPYIRGVLLDLWMEAKKANNNDPLKAWESIVSNPNQRRRYQKARGKGGFRRADWETTLEIIAAACLYTAKKWGPDRVFGFSPIPAMSYLSYASGARFLQLFGGVAMSFYDWYSDLPNAIPEVWGEQTDVAESADWFNARYIIAMGSNISVTRSPDSHFIHEARHNGAKFVVITPEFNATAKNADWWIPIKAGQDTAMWMAINHVILKEFHADRKIAFFLDYLKQYTDAPFLVQLEKNDENFVSKKLLRSAQIKKYADVENAEWKPLMFDKSGTLKMPKGTIGFRWGTEKGKWNLLLEDGLDNSPIEPVLTFIENYDDAIPVKFMGFAEEKEFIRYVPVKYIETTDGKVPVTTVYDLLMAQFGISRGLQGEYPESYDDDIPYTPAWQEKFTGISRKIVIRLAREFAKNAEITQGRSMIIIGTGINHWYYNNLGYRAPITALLLCGCVGRNGGGLNHYVGQEKAVLLAPWATLAFAFDWSRPPRLQQTPIWHFMHCDQWRYEGPFNEYAAVPEPLKSKNLHVADLIAKAVRLGWLPFFPQFNKNPIEIVKEARASGANTEEEIVKWVIEQLKKKKLRYAVQDPDAEENWPRIWFIWRANALMASAKGHEYFLKHYLGTDYNISALERAKDYVKDITWRDHAPEGKMDLVIDINFRMDTSALYSDIVLPAAMWYEKNDLNTTDLHTFIHPLGQVVPPSWEAKTDWAVFREIARKISELAQKHFPEPIEDLVSTPLLHDTPAELAQPSVKDWMLDECEPIPGKTMPNMKIVKRDYVNLYNKFISFGPLARELGIGAHGITFPIKTFYDKLLENPSDVPPDHKFTRSIEWNGKRYPSLESSLDAVNLLLYLAPETNGEIAYRGFKVEEEKVGLPLADLAEKNRNIRYNFDDIIRQPRRALTSPTWSGIINNGRPYAGFVINVEKLVPWRTLTGRQQFYIDHEWYIMFGEQLPTHKPKLDLNKLGELLNSPIPENAKVLKVNFMTPHGKWQIHSTFYDNHRMRVLSRSIEPAWLHPDDAAKIGVKDNDWIEIYNDNGVVVTRAAVSDRIQPGTCLVHHSAERTLAVPKSKIRGGKRAGVHNSLMRIRLNPVLLAGGYAQFTYFFNYWGPVGVNRDCHVIIRKLESNEIEW